MPHHANPDLRHRVPGPQPGIAEIEEALWTLLNPCAAGRAGAGAERSADSPAGDPPAEARADVASDGGHYPEFGVAAVGSRAEVQRMLAQEGLLWWTWARALAGRRIKALGNRLLADSTEPPTTAPPGPTSAALRPRLPTAATPNSG